MTATNMSSNFGGKCYSPPIIMEMVVLEKSYGGRKIN